MNILNDSMTVLLINDDVRAVKIDYDGSGFSTECTIAKTLDQTIKKGDLVVVETGTRHGMTVVKVKEVDVDVDFNSDLKVKWIINKVNLEGYEEIKDKEEQVIASIRKAEVNRKRKELQESIFEYDKDNLLKLSNEFSGSKEEAEDVNSDLPL